MTVTVPSIFVVLPLLLGVGVVWFFMSKWSIDWIWDRVFLPWWAKRHDMTVEEAKASFKEVDDRYEEWKDR